MLASIAFMLLAKFKKLLVGFTRVVIGMKQVTLIRSEPTSTALAIQAGDASC